MLDLPTIKTDFLFENSQNFNQTTHARPQHPIVFIHNISLYFNCISSVKYLFKRSRHSHVTPFFWGTTQAPTQKSLKCRKSTNVSSRIRDFFAFFNFQNGVLWEGIWGGLRKIRFVSILHVISFCNYFKTTLRPNWLSLYLYFCSLSIQSLCWPMCGEVISIPNLRTTCLWCILSPTSFQFFENFQKQW